MSTSAGSASDPVRGPEDRDHGSRAQYADDEAAVRPRDRRSVIARQKEEHGGVKIGSAFFGFLTAVGMSVLLTALLAAAGAAVGVATDTKTGQVTSTATSSADTVGIVSGIVLLVILFLAYYCGGYVAGRMARFDGIKQGIAVWVWALVVAIVVAIVAAVAGSKFDILAQLNSFPRIPVSEGDLTTAGIIAAVAVVVASLGGAILGGLAGMRFHRKVDRTGLGD
jgi:hypothetical protein